MKKYARVLAWLLICAAFSSPGVAAASETALSEPYTVTRVIDGDTLVLSHGQKVRLIGIDTPESRKDAKLFRDTKKSGQEAGAILKMGKAASEFTRSLIEGRPLRLAYDVQKKDKYGRSLAYAYLFVCRSCAIEAAQGYSYVFLGDETYIFVNATIVRSGYASPMTVPPNVKHADLFQKLYKEARDAKRGLWQD